MKPNYECKHAGMVFASNPMLCIVPVTMRNAGMPQNSPSTSGIFIVAKPGSFLLNILSIDPKNEFPPDDFDWAIYSQAKTLGDGSIEFDPNPITVNNLHVDASIYNEAYAYVVKTTKTHGFSFWNGLYKRLPDSSVLFAHTWKYGGWVDTFAYQCWKCKKKFSFSQGKKHEAILDESGVCNT